MAWEAPGPSGLSTCTETKRTNCVAVLDTTQITPANFTVCVDDLGSFIYDNDNNILLQRNSDQTLMYVKQDIVFQKLCNKDDTSSSHLHETIEDVAGQDKSDYNSRVPWTKTEIAQVINLYKQHEHLFKSSTIKNDKVWNIIATKLKTHTPEQCKNKFKYLKGKYVEKKDNMGTKRTGEKCIKFEYYMEFEEIFGRDHNITPVAVASNVRGGDNIPNNEEESVQCTPTEKKRKRSMLEKQLTEYANDIKKREDATAQRHSETLQRQDRALNLFAQIADSFKQIIQQKNQHNQDE